MRLAALGLLLSLSMHPTRAWSLRDDPHPDGEGHSIDINGDFERDENHDGIPDGWFTWVREGHEGEVSFACDSLDTRQGGRSVRITNTGDGASCYCLRKRLELTSASGTVYDLKGFIRATDVRARRAGVRIGTLDVRGRKDSEYVVVPVNGSHPWHRFRVSFAIPVDVVSIDIRLLLEGKGTIGFDGLQLMAREISPDEVIRRDGRSFFKVDTPPETRIPPEDRARDLLLLPEDPDSLGSLRSIDAGRRAQKRLFAAPGERKSFSWGVYSPEAGSILTFEATDLQRSDSAATISSRRIDIRRIRHWNQRVDWRRAGYHSIPELILPLVSDSLPASGLGHYWTSVSIPENQPPGRYRGRIRVLDHGRVRHVIDIRLAVLPFDLVTPATDWGLWVDSPRWSEYSTDEIRQELRSIREAGFTMLSMGPLRQRDFSLRNGEISVNLEEMDRNVRLFEELGFRGPLYLSLQKAQKQIRHLYARQGIELTREAFERQYLRLLESIRETANARKWPDLRIAVQDEVAFKSPDVQDEARDLYGLVRRVGLRTFVTSDVDVVNRKFRDRIDVRLFGMRFVALDDAQNEGIRRDVRERGEPFCWYGSGCYSGQEGRILPNRYLSGFLFWKSGADAEWSWTFQRPRSDPFDDFDGDDINPREPKDACMTYPRRSGAGFIPTLQWEAMREGITDMRYIATLEHYIDLSRHSRRKAAVRRAIQDERRLESIRAEIPWLDAIGFSNRKADEYRREIARRILRLKALLEEDTPERGVAAE